MTNQINIALLGSKFMGRAHSNAWANVGKFFDCDPLPVMHTVAGRNAAELEAFATQWGWQHTSTDWAALIADPDIGLVDIGTPNNVHAEQAIAALDGSRPRAQFVAPRHHHAARRHHHGVAFAGGPQAPDLVAAEDGGDARGAGLEAGGAAEQVGRHRPAPSICSMNASMLVFACSSEKQRRSFKSP